MTLDETVKRTASPTIAWENLEPIQRAQLLHFYPQLREKTLEQIIKEKGGER